MAIANNPRRQVVIAPDKFKGSLDAAGVADAVGTGIRDVLADAVITCVPIADGGDGTVAAALAAGFDARHRKVTGPLGDYVDATYAIDHETAVIEMAQASGLALLAVDDLDALAATSRGTGELIAAALDDGATRVVLGVGGSACTDGGAGMLEALGAAITDAAGFPVPPGGGGLSEAADVDLSKLDNRVIAADFILATDVNNPLLGSYGAAAVYGPQKGADAGQIARLDSALGGFATLVDSAGVDLPGADLPGVDLPGAGAAGGVGYAALAVLAATMRPGIDVVFDLVDFASKFADADLLVTGEGKLDRQTLHGKAPAGAAAFAHERGVPVVAVCGTNELAPDDLGWIRAVYSLTDFEPDIERCLGEPAGILIECGRLIAREHLSGEFG